MASTLSYEQFVHNSPSSLDAFYCVTGDELLLRNETVDRLRQLCREKGYSERVSLVMEASSQWSQIEEHTQSVSLFGDLKILEITIPTGKPGTSGAAALIKLAQQAEKNELSDTVIILSLPNLDKTAAKTQWATQVTQAACTIKIPTINRQNLPRWLELRLNLQKQKVDSSGIDWLCDKVEGNLLAAHQEILKLGLIYPEGKISNEELEQAVLNVARYNVFDMLDCMLSGNALRAVKILKGLKAEGNEVPPLLGLLASNIRQLQALAHARDEGKDLQTVIRQQRIFGPKERYFMNLLKRFNNERKVFGLIQHLNDIDRIFKGIPVEGRLSRSSDAWQEMERLVLRVSGQLS